MQIKAATITTGEAAIRHQTLGLARYLTTDVHEFIVKPPRFFAKLPAILVPKGILNLPDILGANVLISCGRRSAAYSLALKKKHPELFTVHIQNPQIPLRYFDLVVPMMHDNCHGDNVFSVSTALHHLHKEDIKMASTPFLSRIQTLAGRKIAFILGGNTKDYRFTDQKLRELLVMIAEFKRQGFVILLSTARRTPSAIIEELRGHADETTWFYLGEGDNPYLCFLNEADGFIVTSDSVSMVSEVLFTGKPLYLFDLEGFNKRISRFKNNLIQQGLVRLWNGEFEDYSYQAPDSKQDVAARVTEEMKSFNT